MLQHFNPQEQPFIDKVLDWQVQVKEQYAPVLTPFLNPREQFILKQLLGNDDEYVYTYFGGYENAEKQRVLIAPSYYQTAISDYEILPIEIKYATKFNTIQHWQVLGTILGVGIDREYLGDIINVGTRWQFFIDKKLGQFIQLQIDRMGHTPVKLEPITDYKSIMNPTADWQYSETVVSSFRLDTLVAEGFRISRGKAKELITSGMCQVNWMAVTQGNQQIHEGDILSVRGYGRLKLVTYLFKTKKEKFRVKLGIIRSK